MAFGMNLLNAISVQSYGRAIHIPLLIWTLVALYAVSLKALFPGISDSIRRIIGLGVIFGFFLHMYIALADLILALAKDHSFLSEYYFLYIKGISLAFTFGISLSAVLFIRRFSPAPSKRAVYYELSLFAPLFIAPLFFIGLAYPHLNRGYLVSIAVACLVPYLFLKDDLILFFKSAIKRAAAFLWRDRNLITFIFILSFTVRCLFAVNIIQKTELVKTNNFIMASDDGDVYDGIARDVAKDPEGMIGKRAKIWGEHFDYGYPIFLGLIYRIFGRNFYTATFIQSFLGSFLPVIIFLLGKVLFSKPTGALAAIAMALRFPPIFFSVILGHEALWVPFFAVFALALTLYYKGPKHRYRDIAIAGVALGVVCIFRGLYIYLIPFTLLWILLFWKNKTLSEKFTAIAIFMISISIVTASASIIFKSPFSLGSKGRISAISHDEHLFEQFRNLGNDRLAEIDVNFARDFSNSLKNVLKHPAKFLSIAAEIYPMRVIGYLEVYQYGFFDLIYLVNSAKWPNNFMSSLEFYFTLFFLYGLFLCLRRPDIIKSPIFIIITFSIIVSAIIFCHLQTRPRAVITPYIYLIGCYGLEKIVRHLQKLKSDDNGPR